MVRVTMLRSVGGRPELVEGKTVPVSADDAAALVAAGLAVEVAPEPAPEPAKPAAKEKGDK
jgi:hypothetical protein